MTYVIQRTEDGQFVTKPGSGHSYSRSIQKARKFPSREAAIIFGVCENERVITLEEACE